MNIRWPVGLCFSFLILSTLSGCLDKKGKHIAASLPATAAICRSLLDKTGIGVSCPLPKDIAVSDINSFYEEHPALLDSLARCDALVDLRSVISSDRLFIELRRRNIRMVEIDAAGTSADGVSAIAKSVSDSVNFHPWLSFSANLTMAAKTEADLVRLYPEDSATIMKNLGRFNGEISALRSSSEEKFSKVTNFSAATMTSDLDLFLRDIGLSVTARYPSDEMSWTDSDMAAFRRDAKSGAFSVLIHRWYPAGEVSTLADSLGVKLAVLDPGDPAPDAFSNGIAGLLRHNISVLDSVFSLSAK